MANSNEKQCSKCGLTFFSQTPASICRECMRELLDKPRPTSEGWKKIRPLRDNNPL